MSLKQSPRPVTLSGGVRRPNGGVPRGYRRRCPLSVAPSFGGFFDSLRSLRMTVISVVAGLLIGLSAWQRPGCRRRRASDFGHTPRGLGRSAHHCSSIEVLGADGWAQITDMGEFEIPGTYVMRTESQGTRLSETIRGTSYTGQRYQLSVYCQRAGRLEIPALPVTVTVKQWGVNAARDTARDHDATGDSDLQGSAGRGGNPRAHQHQPTRSRSDLVGQPRNGGAGRRRHAHHDPERGRTFQEWRSRPCNTLRSKGSASTQASRR